MTVPGRAYREAARFEAFARGPRLRCIAEPASSPVRGVVLLLPPFAEEMNKSRRMCALLARGLAADGWRVVRIDLFGCGDSAGSLRDATWEQWCDDLRSELDRQLGASAPAVWLWSLRAGALFVPALLAAAPNANLLLWQPVLSGQIHLSQFLRLQAVAALLGAGKAGQPGAASTLAAGDVAEVAGYELPPGVARGLQAAAFDVPANFSGKIAWLDVSMLPGAQPGVATQRAIDRLRGAGHSVTFEEVPGVPFWQSVEIEQNDELLARSRRLVETLSVGSADATCPPMLPMPGAAIAPDDDRVLPIACEGIDLVSVLSAPGAAPSGTGVVVIVGGPQYRVGSHRQFVELARALTRAGHHVLRYDARGMGDSDGAMQGFEAAVPDVLAVIDALRRAAPEVKQVVLWGLCDAASIALMSAGQRRAVTGLVLANPWVRDATSLANATVKQYYRGRVLQAEFWRKLLSGRIDWMASLRSLGANLRAMFGPTAASVAGAGGFQARMARGLAGFQGPVLLLLSSDDLTAREFTEYTAKAPEWAGLLKAERVRTVHLPQADHTFSRRAWKARVEQETISWIDGRLRAP
jgi:exosortase A-associated hydrolase 1/exosortase A-associated hydrolase 2